MLKEKVTKYTEHRAYALTPSKNEMRRRKRMSVELGEGKEGGRGRNFSNLYKRPGCP